MIKRWFIHALEILGLNEQPALAIWADTLGYFPQRGSKCLKLFNIESQNLPDRGKALNFHEEVMEVDGESWE